MRKHAITAPACEEHVRMVLDQPAKKKRAKKQADPEQVTIFDVLQ